MAWYWPMCILIESLLRYVPLLGRECWCVPFGCAFSAPSLYYYCTCVNIFDLVRGRREPQRARNCSIFRHQIDPYFLMNWPIPYFFLWSHQFTYPIVPLGAKFNNHKAELWNLLCSVEATRYFVSKWRQRIVDRVSFGRAAERIGKYAILVPLSTLSANSSRIPHVLFYEKTKECPFRQHNAKAIPWEILSRKCDTRSHLLVRRSR